MPFNDTGVAEQAHRRQRRVRRHAEVVQAPALARQAGLGAIDRGAQRGGTRRERHVVERAREGVPVGIGDLAAEELVERTTRDGAKGIGVDVIERDADDPALRHEAAAAQVV
jgi:hypothetical protein